MEAHGLSDEEALVAAAAKVQSVGSEQVDAARRRARRILRDNWRAVETVARRLVDDYVVAGWSDGKLSAQQLHEVLATALPREGTSP